jgi:mRNA-degrading endonuclease toxin of MazEF toxin-antitoxin module
LRRGELRWGAPSLVGPARKKRPFLVVSADAFNLNDQYPKVMVVHLTSVERSETYDWEVRIARGVAGLPRRSIVKCSEIYTLNKHQLGELIGTLPRDHIDRVDEALAVALSLPIDAAGFRSR